MKLKNYLKKQKITSCKFAKMINVNRSTIWHILNTPGRNNYGIKLAYKISKATNGAISLFDLISKKDRDKLDSEISA